MTVITQHKLISKTRYCISVI